ncbi:MAG TPA: hypothetical protein VMT85_06060 [Thermoanaerobaculia bacterium]|nr:hypothetical protein [Thermoanaerobaculia bacterium]
MFESIGATASELAKQRYLAGEGLATSLFLALRMGKPLFLEGEPGVDKTEEEFESFLLELLSDFQVTIPELGTLRARHRPIVILKSNRTREIHDALERRCVYHWIDYPTFDRELEIVRLKTQELPVGLARQVVDVVQRLRQRDLFELPGLAETLDWAEALTHLRVETLDPTTVSSTLGFLLEVQDDVAQVHRALASGELVPVEAV